MKKILLVSYSQTGQLTQLAQSFIAPLEQEEGVNVEHLQLQPQQAYPFPWGFHQFFNTFPETVRLQPAPIQDFELQSERYDLIIIAYSVWFLSPSQPITAFLQHPKAQTILRNTPVITLIGCRNMWLMAQEKVKKMLESAGGRLVGNIVKVDQCNDWASFITTPMWLLTGKKQAISWLPKAGIADDDIADMARFGNRLLQKFRENRPLDRGLFQGMGAVSIDEKLMMSEQVGNRSFQIWGNWLIKSGRISPSFRQLLLYVYVVFLVAMILTVVPISAIIKRCLKPLFKQKLAEQKRYFAEPSGE